jgi:DNA-nicking Smr family endonuclease
MGVTMIYQRPPQRHTFDDKARDHVIDNSSQPSVRQPKRVASRLALESFDPRLKKKIVRGHAPLEARLDLHGLTQDEAFATLSHFIKSAHGRGLRHVLVITGKGQRTKGLNPSSEKSSGVLKRQVPQWLALPALSPFVLMVDYASPLHGGEGALYVRLRASRQSITSDGENVL